MTRIDYFYFPLSPFTYLAGTGLEEVAGKHGAEIRYRPFNLMQVFAEIGTPPLPERHESRKRYRLQDLARISARAGLPINLQPAHFPTNPVPACSAVIMAQKAGGGDLGGLAHGLLRACWAEEKDIAEDAVVADCLEAAGFDRGLVNKGMLEAVEEYERNTRDALDAGVFGAPTYIVGDQIFWGQDRLPYLDAFLGAAG